MVSRPLGRWAVGGLVVLAVLAAGGMIVAPSARACRSFDTGLVLGGSGDRLACVELLEMAVMPNPRCDGHA